MSARPKHPGRTAAERRVLNDIGCGYFTPHMSPKTREAMLKAGLIIPAGEKMICRDRFGTVTATEYAMPIPVHMQWCSAVASDEDPTPC